MATLRISYSIGALVDGAIAYGSASLPVTGAATGSGSQPIVPAIPPAIAAGTGVGGPAILTLQADAAMYIAIGASPDPTVSGARLLRSGETIQIRAAPCARISAMLAADFGVTTGAVYSLSALGSTPAVPVNPEWSGQRKLPPSILVGLSAGASLTYTVEMTGDAPDSQGNFPSPGNWFGFGGMVGLAASANGVLAANVSGIRCRVTSYTSGTLTFQVVQ